MTRALVSMTLVSLLTACTAFLGDGDDTAADGNVEGAEASEAAEAPDPDTDQATATPTAATTRPTRCP